MDLPRLLARVREGDGIGSRIDGGHGDLMAADMIRVRIAAVLVVGGHDLGPKLPDKCDEGPDDLVKRERCEAPLWKRWQRITFRVARVLESEPGMSDAENLGRQRHLAPTHLRKAKGRDVVLR